MVSRQVETSIYCALDRSVSPRAICDLARLCETSGVVDDLFVSQQLGSFFPREMFRPPNAAPGEAFPDGDSFADAWVLASMAAAATSNLGVTVGSDACRLGPWITQTMLTLAHAVEGRAKLLLGAGEIKNVKPFGYNRARGLKSLEDMLQIFRLLLETNEPVSFEGNVWHLDDAYIGNNRPYTPEVWAMGGGPKLLDMAGRYADGLCAAAPGAFTSPERWGEQIALMRSSLERHGRDPDDFGYGLLFVTLMHEDSEVIERAFSHPFMRFFSSVVGRFKQSDWPAEGVQPVWPLDWHYGLKFLPTKLSRAEIDNVTAGVTPDMVQKSLICGTPDDIARYIQPYIDEGTTWVSVVDFTAAVLPPEEAPTSFARMLDVCARTKGRPLDSQLTSTASVLSRL